MNGTDIKVKAVCSKFFECFEDLNLNYVVCLKVNSKNPGVLIYTNTMPEEAVCTITNTIPMIFHPEWSGLPWDIPSNNVVNRMADELIEKLEPFTEKVLVCLTLAGDDSRGGIIKYHSIHDALLCMLAAVHQMYDLLETLQEMDESQ